MLNYKIAILLSLTLITACSSKKTDPNDFDLRVKDTFSTKIEGDGIKIFIYKAQLAALDNANILLPPSNGIQQSSEHDKQPNLNDWTQQIELGLSKTLTMTGFCREGFMELSRIIEIGMAEIRGECNEGATERDKSKFSS